MLSNRRVDTKPERLLRSALHRRGLRFRKDRRLILEGIPVRPDIVFGPARVAVYVDGCFWHRCPLHASDPKTNADYWKPKLERNVERDLQADAALAASGWTVVRCWEHESIEDMLVRVVEALAASDQRCG
jgi:DNA mismatch endonuclease (patch repair protein)